MWLSKSNRHKEPWENEFWTLKSLSYESIKTEGHAQAKETEEEADRRGR